ncbi:PotD/PotF family extracellular solute-binding protein [Pseudoruegeria sp. HB172150]|uniref:ABC transporter substrate-binding protein n=1 Tax=Pseudoruegeria sp. HB172150 TaxID=2721164 RepID=UPI0020A634D2|nr:extracellular solute-binding protein [Pseudoruegeria sp. HB172150]
MNWRDYGTDLDWAVAAYTARTGNTVVHEYFTSEEEMLAKLRNSPDAYDVVLVNSAYTAEAKEEGLIARIDTTKIPNFGDIDPSLANNGDLNPGGELYGVPWTWGLTSIAVNTDDFTELPSSLSVLWDPQWTGRVSIRDDGLEAVQFAAMATGQSINHITDLASVEAKLEQLLPQIGMFWTSETEWNRAMSAGELAVATYWSGSVAHAQALGLPVTFIVPEEGAIGWLDGLSIPAGSRHKDAAAAFIDWMIDPEFYVKWDAEGAPVSSNAKALAALPETSFNRILVDHPATIARVQFVKPVSETVHAAYEKLWSDLKASR